MLCNVYRITIIGEARAAMPAGSTLHWDVTANTLESAWRKFCRQRFGALLPDPSDYDVRFLDARSYGAQS